jgi:zinc/manganese transport system ATP-binding protein
MTITSTIETPPGATDVHSAVRVEDVDVRAGSNTLLSGVSLTVPTGALVVIAGGSGAGKTTLLEVMAGFRSPSRGPVTIGR